MIRFMCTVCKKVKRVRQQPDSFDNVNFTISPARGTCRRHNSTRSRAAVEDRVKLHPVHKKSLKVSTPKKGKS